MVSIRSATSLSQVNSNIVKMVRNTAGDSKVLVSAIGIFTTIASNVGAAISIVVDFSSNVPGVPDGRVIQSIINIAFTSDALSTETNSARRDVRNQVLVVSNSVEVGDDFLDF